MIRLSEGQTTAIIARYTAGESSIPLAREYGVTPATMRRKLVKAGVTMRQRGGRRKLSPAQESNVVREFLKGEKQEVLCLEYGVSRKTVYRILRNAGARQAARWIEGVHILGGMAVKRCSSCWVTRPLAEFYDDCTKREGIRSNCRHCEK